MSRRLIQMNRLVEVQRGTLTEQGKRRGRHEPENNGQTIAPLCITKKVYLSSLIIRDAESRITRQLLLTFLLWPAWGG
jgi:hypothetical protein